jgi:hypothetical protein
MNEKEKAEKYVRSQIKELMEPKAGCRLIWKGEAWHEHGIMLRGGKLSNLTLSNLTTGKIEQRDDTWEIIGHPIELQHWLRVFEKISTRFMYCLNLDGELIKYVGENLDVPTHAMWFNLTTGQPATEADYQAFNQIVGICKTTPSTTPPSQTALPTLSVLSSPSSTPSYPC